jgi:hypothetical protein
MNTQKSANTLSSLVRTLVGLSLAVMLTFVSVPGVTAVGATPLIEHINPMADPPIVN